jgi:hypothetical protein
LTKHELELRRLTLSSVNLREWLSLAKHVITVIGAIACARLMFSGIENIAAARPESLKALALVVEQMHRGSLMGYLIAAMTGFGWFFERTGKKRAIRKLGESRRQLECGDPCNSRSGLTATGETPF